MRLDLQMKMYDVYGKKVTANINQSEYPLRGKNSRSEFQSEVGKVLLDKFPLFPILEEWPIPASRLEIDFFIPQLMIAIEVNGDQHKKYNKFFHASIADFKKQKNRDKRKRDWCELNGITLIDINNIDEVEEKINGI